MKNHILIGSAITSFCALMLYSTSLHQQANAKLTIEDGTNKIVSSRSQSQLPESHRVRITAKSNRQLAAKIKSVFGTGLARYAVDVHEISAKGKSAQVMNTGQKTFNVGNILQLYVLLAYQQAVKTGAIKANATHQVTAAELVGHSSSLRVGTTYGDQYIITQMLHNDLTASSIMLKVVTPDRVNRVARQYGASQTKITAKFGASKVGVTTATDLAVTLQALYQGKGLGNPWDRQVLTQLASYRVRKISQNVSGTVAQISDAHDSAALITIGKHTVVIAAVSDGSGSKLPALGQAVNQFFLTSK